MIVITDRKFYDEFNFSSAISTKNLSDDTISCQMNTPSLGETNNKSGTEPYYLRSARSDEDYSVDYQIHYQKPVN